MFETLRRLLENYLPPLLDSRRLRWLLFWLFWPSSVVMGGLFLLTNPWSGLILLAAPLLLMWRTRRRGLAAVSRMLLVPVAVVSLVPAFFLGMYQASENTPTGYVLAGFLAFLLWVTTFPSALERMDERHRAGAAADPGAEFRLTVIRLWMATVVMLVVGEQFAAVVCVVALLYRRPWSAYVAGVVCAVLPLLSVEFGQIVWDGGWVEVPAAALAAYEWWKAGRQPLWPPGMVAEARRHPAPVGQVLQYDGAAAPQHYYAPPPRPIDPSATGPSRWVQEALNALPWPACPVQAPWELSASALLGHRVPRAAKAPARLLNRFCRIHLSPQAVALDSSGEIPWARVTEVRTRALGDVLSEDLIGRISDRATFFVRVPGAAWAARRITLLLTEAAFSLVLLAVGDRAQFVHLQVPVELVHRDGRRTRTVRPGTLSAVVLAVPQYGQSLLATAQAHRIPIVGEARQTSEWSDRATQLLWQRVQRVQQQLSRLQQTDPEEG